MWRANSKYFFLELKKDLFHLKNDTCQDVKFENGEKSSSLKYAFKEVTTTQASLISLLSQRLEEEENARILLQLKVSSFQSKLQKYETKLANFEKKELKCQPLSSFSTPCCSTTLVGVPSISAEKTKRSDGVWFNGVRVKQIIPNADSVEHFEEEELCEKKDLEEKLVKLSKTFAELGIILTEEKEKFAKLEVVKEKQNIQIADLEEQLRKEKEVRIKTEGFNAKIESTLNEKDAQIVILKEKLLNKEKEQHDLQHQFAVMKLEFESLDEKMGSTLNERNAQIVALEEKLLNKEQVRLDMQLQLAVLKENNQKVRRENDFFNAKLSQVSTNLSIEKEKTYQLNELNTKLKATIARQQQVLQDRNKLKEYLSKSLPDEEGDIERFRKTRMWPMSKADFESMHKKLEESCYLREQIIKEDQVLQNRDKLKEDLAKFGKTRILPMSNEDKARQKGTHQKLSDCYLREEIIKDQGEEQAEVFKEQTGKELPKAEGGVDLEKQRDALQFREKAARFDAELQEMFSLAVQQSVKM